MLWWHLSRYHWFDIPGLGVFEADVQDSFIDHLGGSIHPSRLNLKFRASLVSQSNEMLDHLVREFGYPLDELQAKLTALSRVIEKTFQKGSSFVFEPFGTLIMRPDGLQFESGLLNLHPHFFGLEPLPLQAIQRKYQGPVLELGSPVKPIPKKSSEMKILLVILGVLWFIFLCLILWPKKESKIVKSNLPANELESPLTGEDSAILKSLKETPNEKPDTNSAISNVQDSTPKIEEVLIKKENVDSLNKSIRHRDCIIIVGSFTKLDNANRLSKELEKNHYTPYRGNYGRFHRVGVQFNCFDRNLAEVLAELKKIYHPDSWILKM